MTNKTKKNQKSKTTSQTNLKNLSIIYSTYKIHISECHMSHECENKYKTHLDIMADIMAEFNTCIMNLIENV